MIHISRNTIIYQWIHNNASIYIIFWKEVGLTKNFRMRTLTSYRMLSSPIDSMNPFHRASGTPDSSFIFATESVISGVMSYPS